MRKIEACGKWIGVKRIAKPETSPGGIVLPQTAGKPPAECEVVSVGPEAKNAKVGDRGLIAQYAGAEIDVDGAKVLFVRDEDLLCVLREATP